MRSALDKLMMTRKFAWRPFLVTLAVSCTGIFPLAAQSLESIATNDNRVSGQENCTKATGTRTVRTERLFRTPLPSQGNPCRLPDH